ncbi:MAG: alkaline phosphatase, partial [Rikenellaceae bacterium]
LENISTTLHNRGLKVGIISTASIDHATPASFYAHQPSRDMYFEISEELPTSNFEFFGGGGILENDNFNDKVTKQGYRVVNTKGAIDSLKNGDEKVIAISPTLQDSKSMTYAIDRKEGEFTLADFVKKGIEVLDNEKGFFMMAEGGKIDWLHNS